MESSTPFGNSASVFEWISSFINFERDLSSKSFRLNRMMRLAELADHPELCAPAVHVAGSKGKGSVTGMAAAILEAGGIRTSRYASPHVSDFRERISLGNRFFDESLYAHGGNALRAVTETMIKEGNEPTYFELMTMWFFLVSRISGSGAMAVETGLGGRLDATNILDPVVSAITVIELEHTETLGDTLEAIAGEKAGIIKKGKPLVLAEQNSKALEVFKQKAREQKSPFLYFPEWGTISHLRISSQGTTFNLKLKNPGKTQSMRRGDPVILEDLHIPIPGEIQAANAGLAVLAVKTAFPGIPDGAVRKGLEGFTIPARFEGLRSSPAFIIDGAHTARSIAECIKTFTCLYGEKGLLLFGCASGKDVHSMAETLVPHFSRIIITTPGTFKKSNPMEVYSVFAGEGKKAGNSPDIAFCPGTAQAIDLALKISAENGIPALGAGSFYLAAEIRLRISGKDA
ncbi:MAG: tetrahydrofolate synthase [Treponema sp.]|nr:tetrahydrofolate synthase [Treponema sp.]